MPRDLLKSPLFGVLGICGAFVLGYLVAHSGSEAGSEESASITTHAIENQNRFNETHKTIEGEAWNKTKEELIKRYENSPSIHSDYPLLEETYALLQKVSVADLKSWLLEWNTVPRTDWDISDDMQEMIVLVLAHRDPEHLIQFLIEHPEDTGDILFDDVIELWADHDPLTFLQWLEKGNIPTEINEDKNDYLEEALVILAFKNPNEFEKKLKEVSSDMRVSILQNYAYQTESATGRTALLERAEASEHEEAMALWKGILQRESEYQPEKAFATLEQLDLSESDHQTLDLQLLEWILPFVNSECTAEVMQNWLKKNPERAAPTVMLETYIVWFHLYQQDAVEWINRQPMDTRNDVFAKLTIEQRVNEEEKDYNVFATLAQRIQDPSTRISSLRLIKDSWHSKDPSAASEWEKSLSVEDREALK